MSILTRADKFLLNLGNLLETTKEKKISLIFLCHENKVKIKMTNMSEQEKKKWKSLIMRCQEDTSRDPLRFLLPHSKLLFVMNKNFFSSVFIAYFCSHSIPLWHDGRAAMP